MVEVKWSSGKSLLVHKVTLEIIMGSTGLSKVAVSKTSRTCPEMQVFSAESFIIKKKQVEVGEYFVVCISAVI